MTTTVINQQQMQQPNVQIYPQHAQQGCIPLAAVPVHLHRSVQVMAIAMLILGAICILFGVISLLTLVSFPSYSGVNIWVGLMVS